MFSHHSPRLQSHPPKFKFSFQFFSVALIKFSHHPCAEIAAHVLSVMLIGTDVPQCSAIALIFSPAVSARLMNVCRVQ